MAWKISRKYKKLFLYCFFIFLLTFIGQTYFFQKPSNNRNWQEQFATLADISINGNQVKVNNIRDYKYDPNGITEKNYINREFDVTKIEKVWFLVEPFGAFEGIAHTYFVFDFVGSDPVAISVESRREVGEDFWASKGLFNKYELIYIWATENDQTIRRSIYDQEDLYMFPLLVSKEASQKLFLELAKKTEYLETNARFYNTLFHNCTNELAYTANTVKPGIIPFHYALYMPGYAPNLLHSLKLIPSDESLDAVKDKYFISEKVKSLYKEQNFSEKLRQSI